MPAKSPPQRAAPPDAAPWHARPAAAAVDAFDSDAASGLRTTEAEQRLARYGPNRLERERREHPLEQVFEALREPMILLLLATAILYAVFGSPEDALTLLGVIAVVVALEVYNERRAERALVALRQLGQPQVPVLRGGLAATIPTEQVVPGDLLLLAPGQQVAADARLTQSLQLAATEAALTGESLPVEKSAGAALEVQTPLAERATMVYAGTQVARGHGTALVVATGSATEVGRLAALAGAARPPRTPLQLAMRRLTRWLVWLALGLSTLLPLLGMLLAGQPPRQMLLTGLALTFATIPEELPILVTVVLALGAYRLARRRAIVKRLRAVESLSAITTILTDKTGTLTTNRMALRHAEPEAQRATLLRLGALCNEAVPGANGPLGDPLDVALLEAAARAGLDVAALRAEAPLLAVHSFDAERRRMAVVTTQADGPHVTVKGAPEAVLERSSALWHPEGVAPLGDAARADWLAHAEALTAQGLRVLAVAERALPRDASPRAADAVERDLALVGLLGFEDPPRPEAEAAVAACRASGIRVVMVTGDHPRTAGAVARAVGIAAAADAAPRTGAELAALAPEALAEVLAQTAVVARATPEHKLRLVRALQERGERVAVTGDGINDAPALAAADLGIAMGRTGTDVAREAASIVLADDNFATLAHALEEGRLLVANLTKAIRFYLAAKVALVSVLLLPTLLLLPPPFSPVQIIITELFMDVAASATFVSERAERTTAHQPPRDPRRSLLDRAMVGSILVAALTLLVAVVGVYLACWYGGATPAQARTAAFATWLLAHVALAQTLRSERTSLWRQGLFSNRLMLLWAAATVSFAALVVYLPAVAARFETVPLTGGQVLLVLAAALACALAGEARKRVGAARGRARL